MQVLFPDSAQRSTQLFCSSGFAQPMVAIARVSISVGLAKAVVPQLLAFIGTIKSPLGHLVFRQRRPAVACRPIAVSSLVFTIPVADVAAGRANLATSKQQRLRQKTPVAFLASIYGSDY